MEELVSTEALEREILEDARRKAERVMRVSGEEELRIAREGEARTKAALAELERSYSARNARYCAEALARIPLEEARMKAAFLDRSLGAALEDFIAALPESKIADLAGRLLAKGADFLAGRELSLLYRGIGAELARETALKALPRSSIASFSASDALAAAGFEAAATDGSVVMRATLDIAAEELLREKRGELVKILCAGAIDL